MSPPAVDPAEPGTRPDAPPTPPTPSDPSAPATPATPAARLARLDDADEVVRLAGVMYAAMGDEQSPAWQAVAARAFRTRLGSDLAVFVVDDPDRAGTLAASAAGTVATRLPGVLNQTGRVAYLQWVATDPRWRRHGCARAVLSALLAEYRAQQVMWVELHATGEAHALYSSLGFGPGAYPGLRLRLLEAAR